MDLDVRVGGVCSKEEEESQDVRFTAASKG